MRDLSELAALKEDPGILIQVEALRKKYEGR